MPVLTGDLIQNRLSLKSENPLVITPILDDSQYNPASIDLRLGCEFKVSIPTRHPIMGITQQPMESFFQDTFRNFGEDFILHPNQLVLVNTFEYIKLPLDLMGMISVRSSLNRLGININSIVHPGYAGTLTLQLENNSTTPINLTCGMRIIQLSLIKTSSFQTSYITNHLAKYIGNTSPTTSQINLDPDLEILKKISS